MIPKNRRSMSPADAIAECLGIEPWQLVMIVEGACLDDAQIKLFAEVFGTSEEFWKNVNDAYIATEGLPKA